jgi:hypothetical protein
MLESKEVEVVSQQAIKAFESGNRELMASLMFDGFVFVDVRAGLFDRQHFLDEILPQFKEHAVGPIKIVSLQTDGLIASVVYEVQMDQSIIRESGRHYYHIYATLARSNGRWEYIVSHSTVTQVDHNRESTQGNRVG